MQLCVFSRSTQADLISSVLRIYNDDASFVAHAYFKDIGHYWRPDCFCQCTG